MTTGIPLRNSQAINVVLFSEMDVEKSEVINLISQHQVTKPPSHIQGSLLQTIRHDITFDDMNVRLFETTGLKKPRIGIDSYLKALENAHEFVVKLGAVGGVHLLLFVMKAEKIETTTQSSYRLFLDRKSVV